MRTDYDASAIKHGVAREGLAYLAHGLMYGFGYIGSRYKPRRARDQRTLVFVHGLGANRASFFPLQAYLRLSGYEHQYAFNYGVGASIEAMAIDLGTRLKEHVRGGRIDLICHSMGGLVARYWLQVLGGHRRVDRLITLATPHHGSHPSVYFPSALMWQFKPGGKFLDHLNRQPPPPHVRCWSFAAGRDHIVLPPASALAPFGEVRRFHNLGHQSMLLSPRVFAAVRLALEEPVDAADALDDAAGAQEPEPRSTAAQA